MGVNAAKFGEVEVPLSSYQNKLPFKEDVFGLYKQSYYNEEAFY